MFTVARHLGIMFDPSISIALAKILGLTTEDARNKPVAGQFYFLIHVFCDLQLKNYYYTDDERRKPVILMIVKIPKQIMKMMMRSESP